MRILIVPSWYYSQNTSVTSGIFFKEFAEALAIAGHEIAVLYFEIEFNLKKKKEGFNHNVVNGVNEFRYIQRNYTPKSALGVELQKLMKTGYMSSMIEKEFGIPDVIHLESSGMINIANKLKKRWNVPVVYTEHLSNILSDNPARFYKSRFETALKTADACTAISSVYKRKMIKYKPTKLTQIPNGINLELLRKSSEPDVFTVKALGSLRKIKGYDVLIKAFAEFAKSKEDVLLEIGGEGPEKDKLLLLISQLGMNDKILLTGSVERLKIADFYDRTSVFVCSSETETFSVVTAEALCSGIPVISTRCGGPEDMINENNGILIDTGSIEQLRLALDNVYNNRREYDRSKIKLEAEESFSYERIIGEYEDLYRRLITNGIGK